MRLLSTRKLDARGFAHHFLLPILAVLVVAGIGAAVLSKSHAATTTSYYTSSCINTTYGAPNSTFNQCVQDAQILLNGMQHHDANNDLKLSVYAGSSFQYGSLVYLLMNGLYGKYTATAVTSATGNTAGQLTAGQTGTWQHLCTIAASKGLNADNSVLNFSSATGVTGGSTQYLKAAVSSKAAFAYDCGNKVSSTSSGSTTASSSKACTSYTISTSSNPTPKGSKCVYYLQTIINGAWESNPYSYTSVAKAYDAYFKQSSSGPIGGVSASESNYNQLTATRIRAFQAVAAYNGTPLNVTGTTDGPTWGALCDLAHSYGSGNSYIQAAKTAAAAADSGCNAVTGKISSAPHQTTPPPLNCTGGSSMNSAKTGCVCPSGQVYSGGKCVTPAPVASSGGTSSGGSASGNGLCGLTTSTLPNGNEFATGVGCQYNGKTYGTDFTPTVPMKPVNCSLAKADYGGYFNQFYNNLVGQGLSKSVATQLEGQGEQSYKAAFSSCGI
ncbi:MAG TPA: hypothetical protein VGM08_02005 [Candidatus Saccharimonadales bacterium]|jgi:hypothetical protein